MDRTQLAQLLDEVRAGTCRARGRGARRSARCRTPRSRRRSSIDHHRELRTGVPSSSSARARPPSRSPPRCASSRKDGGALATRVDADEGGARCSALAARRRRITRLARIVALGARRARPPCAPIAVVCAGTSDLPVAEEAALVAEFLGAPVLRISDVGVAGLHRLLARLDDIRALRRRDRRRGHGGGAAVACSAACRSADDRGADERRLRRVDRRARRARRAARGAARRASPSSTSITASAPRSRRSRSRGWRCARDRDDPRGLHLHFDCASGAAGDMMLGALIDLGVPVEVIGDALDAIGAGRQRLRVERVTKGGIAATTSRSTRRPAVRGARASHASDEARGDRRVGGSSRSSSARRRTSATSTSTSTATRPRSSRSRCTRTQSRAHALRATSASACSTRSSPKARAAARSTSSTGSRAPRPSCTARPSSTSCSTRSARSTRSSMSSARRPRSTGSRPPASRAPSVAMGHGTLKCAHGVLPVPAPAALEVLRDAGGVMADGGLAARAVHADGRRDPRRDA